jgi:hypothetical protein
MNSYQVPKEVGKVGTESPSFIEPVANRKDGIQAMFSKQRQADSSPSPTKSPRPQSSTKRKLEGSPVRSQEPELTATAPSPTKKLKTAVGEDFDQPVGSKPHPRSSPKKRKATKVIPSPEFSLGTALKTPSESFR